MASRYMGVMLSLFNMYASQYLICELYAYSKLLITPEVWDLLWYSLIYMFCWSTQFPAIYYTHQKYQPTNQCIIFYTHPQFYKQLFLLFKYFLFY